jgi:two-component system OmpR family sensor kinase
VTAEGIALLCDPAGTIQELVRDGIGVAERVAPGQPLTDLVDPPCVDKTRAFLEALRAQNAAFNWELNVPVAGGRVESLHFAGGAAEGGFLVVGARSRSGVTRFYEELIRINNEQTNALRAALKDASLQTRAQADRDGRHFDELSQLNNDLANAQRDLAKNNVELTRLNDQKSQFLGMAAHDLRNPLEVILTYSDFLMEEAAPSLPPEQAAFISTIRSSSEFMLRLVEDLLDLSRIEAGKLELDLERVDLGALVERNVALNGVLAAKKGTEVRLVRGDGPFEMVVDSSKIEQVLNNLIGNAVKFSPPGSTVEVRLDRDAQRVRLAVADQGPGVPADEMDKLFRPFERTRVRSAGGEKSTGLGLALVKRIVEGHQGEIGVESEPGRGATFRVSLPARGLETSWPRS